MYWAECDEKYTSRKLSLSRARIPVCERDGEPMRLYIDSVPPSRGLGSATAAGRPSQGCQCMTTGPVGRVSTVDTRGSASARSMVWVVVSGGGGSRGNESGGCRTHSNTNLCTYDCGLVDLRGANGNTSAGGHGRENESEKEVDRESSL
ncbi:hypothetical protein EDD15DRAFT_2194961 [Pisolithus albus]|nr:hypothetical protein EDD15DRAFT_2194961 [Pisolithus albus]